MAILEEQVQRSITGKREPETQKAAQGSQGTSGDVKLGKEVREEHNLNCGSF